MYAPYFTITPHITEYLTRIGIIYGILEAKPLPSQYQKEYQSKILSEIIQSSTAIEGNRLTQKQVDDVLKGNTFQGYERDIKEVENYYKAIKYITHLPLKTGFHITEKVILKINALILKGIRDEAGTYRTKEMFVGPYIAPKPSMAPSLMKQFVSWLQNPSPPSLSPILYSGIAHYQLVAIHPFIDGNGRTTRILTKLILKKYGFDFMKYFSLESYYNRERRSYYTALNSADANRVDGKPNLTQWLDYFTLALFVQARQAQKQIEALLKKSKYVPLKIHLNQRQKKLISYLKKNQSIKTSQYMKMSDLSSKGAYNELQKLVKAGVLKKKGTYKSSFYTLTKIIGYF